MRCCARSKNIMAISDPLHPWVAIAAATTTLAAMQLAQAAGTITYVGVIYDRTDFDRLNIGNAGSWFPQFGGASPVATRPTGENARTRCRGGRGRSITPQAFPTLITPREPSRRMVQPAPKADNRRGTRSSSRAAKLDFPVRSSIRPRAEIPTTPSTGFNSMPACPARFTFTS